MTAEAMAAPAGRAEALAFLRLMLGRDPAEDEVASVLATAPSLAQLRLDLLRHPDFQREARRHMDWLPLAPDPLAVETDADPEASAAMLARVGAYWERIGREKPHWSVLTQPRFLPENIDRHRDEFDRSGRGEARVVLALLARHGIPRKAIRHVVDFGCGVGRTTLALAPFFGRVTGCDISLPHMAIAREEAASRGLGNLAWHRTTAAEPMPPGRWDLWHSRIVLQHNPPPVIVLLLRLAFAGLRPGGIAAFQVTTHCTGYAFSVAAHLARTEEPWMEMHVLPQPRVLALAAEAGLELLEVREDRSTGSPATWLSNFFVMRRPR